MVYWKQILRRLALSTASLAIIAAIGGLLGAIIGSVLELLLQAFLNVALPVLVVIPVCGVLGIWLSVVWGFAVLARNKPAPIPAEEKPSDAGAV
ncbi:MAG: hypothetical protein ACR2M0_14255 [Chloroflexia bacterium]